MDPSHDTRGTHWFVLSVEDDADDLHGTIESTRGDLRLRFASGRELLEILSGAGAGDDEPKRSAEGREKSDA